MFFFIIRTHVCNVMIYSRRIFSRLIRLAAVTAAFRAKRLLLVRRRRVGLNATSVQDGCAQLGGSRSSALGLCPVGRSFLFILTFVVVTHSPRRSASSLLPPHDNTRAIIPFAVDRQQRTRAIRSRPRLVRPYDHGTVEPDTGQPDPRAAAVGGLRVRLRVRRSGAVAEGRRR